MAHRGNTRPHANTIRRKFKHVTQGGGPALYVAELTNGVIKVGYTASPRNRLSAVQTHARAFFGAVDVAKFHATEAANNAAEARHAEQVALQRITQIAVAASESPWAGEFFRGISFERAVEIAVAAVRMYDFDQLKKAA